MTVIATAAFAQPEQDERDRGQGGAITNEQLRNEPITFDLDIPYAATANPRQQLDLDLPKNRKTGKLPVIVFFHGGGWLQGNKSDGTNLIFFVTRMGPAPLLPACDTPDENKPAPTAGIPPRPTPQ